MMKLTKARSQDWFKSPSMLGHIWAKESVVELENICTKYGKTNIQKKIINEIVKPLYTWNEVNSLTKKDIGLLRYALKNSSTKTMNQILNHHLNKIGYLKSNLTRFLEYLAVCEDENTFIKNQMSGYSMFMGKEDALERSKEYVKQLKERTSV